MVDIKILIVIREGHGYRELAVLQKVEQKKTGTS